MIGERLAEVRKDHDHTQQNLAELLHVSTPTVRAWEQGKSSPPHDMLVTICRLYRVSADYLLGLTDEYSPGRGSRRHLTREEQALLAEFEAFLLWRRKNRK